MQKTWWQLKQEFDSKPEKLEAEFRVAIHPYKFIKRDLWADYNYVHWLVYAPEKDLDEQPSPYNPHMPIVVIGGHSREAEARNMALRLAEARKAGYWEGYFAARDRAIKEASSD